MTSLFLGTHFLKSEIEKKKIKTVIQMTIMYFRKWARSLPRTIHRTKIETLKDEQGRVLAHLEQTAQ